MGTEVRALTQFRVLGALQASRDGEPLHLGGERQRALLALLLVHANELMSTERLIDQLFGGEPSDSAANALHVAISRLRRALQGGDRDLLITRPGGYLLVLAPEQLDAAQFERLLHEGRDRLAGGDPAAAAVRLREALALWRGPPLADLALLHFLAPEARRLEELRLLALMESFDADLALGKQAPLIPEIEKLVLSEPLQERLRGQLMLALYRCGRQAEALEVFRQTSSLLREQLGLQPSRALQELERMVLQQDPSLAPAPAPTSPTANELPPQAAQGNPDRPVVCPFKGLASFDSADAEYFCGRGRLVSDLVARLAESSIVGLIGPSGIGKSSLLRAGVLPALRAGALPRSASWRQVLMRPGAHPCEELERALGGERLDEALARLSSTERILLAVDQLEELFTLCEHEAERSAFLEQLAGAAQDPERRVLILCALRADFYGRFAFDQRFAQLLSHSHALIGPMDRDQLAQAIEQPASRAGLTIERALVDALVAAVVDQPGGLPLLSTTLLELWLARDGCALRFESYRTIGGLRGAVGRMAEAAYAQLSEHERRVARNVMLRLASGEPGALVRRRVSLPELEQLHDGGRVLAILTEARLLTVGDGEAELSHEALLREWPRYRTWLEEDRIGRRLHTHLIAAAREWDLQARDQGELYRGARLAGALEWTVGNRERCNALEREFIDVSRRQANREARRQRSQHRRLRRLRLAAVSLLALALLAGAFALAKQRSAIHAAHLAAADARAALGRQLGAEAVSEPRLDLAMLLARQAVDLNRSQQTEGTLLTTLLRSPAVIGSFVLQTTAPGQLAVSSDGRTLAVSDDATGRLSFYDTATRAVRAQTLTDFAGAGSPVYSGDGNLLVYPTGRGEPQALAVRDAHTLALIDRLALGSRFAREVRTGTPAGSVVIAPDRRSIYYAYWVTGAAGPSAAFVDRWSLPAGRLVSSIRIGSGALLGVRLVQTGHRLLVVSGHRIVWLDARSLRPLRSVAITPAVTAPSAAAISPDGTSIAIGSHGGSVSFVNTSTGTAHSGIGSLNAAVAGVFYSSDGRTVTSVGGDDAVILWNSRTDTPIETLDGPTGQVQSVATSPGATTLYTSSLDGELLVWDLTGARQFGHRASLGAGVRCCSALLPHAPPLAESPDGSRFAVRLGTSTIGLFSTRTLRRLETFTTTPRTDDVTALAWSPTEPLLAVAGHAGLVQIWSLAGPPRLVRSLVGLHSPIGHREAIQALAFAPDGRLLAASDENETRPAPDIAALPTAFLAVWRTSSGALIGPPRDLEVGSSSRGSDALAFAPRGQLLAASLPDGRVLVLDATTGQVRQTLNPASGSTSLAFTRSGTLATGTAAGTVQLWNPWTGQRLAPALIAASAPITNLAFDPSGQRFATAGYRDGTVKLWFTSTLQQEGPALNIDSGESSTAVFTPDGAGLLVIEDHGSAFSWPTSLLAWEQRACSVAGRNLSHPEWDRFVAQSRYVPVCR